MKRSSDRSESFSHPFFFFFFFKNGGEMEGENGQIGSGEGPSSERKTNSILEEGNIDP